MRDVHLDDLALEQNTETSVGNVFWQVRVELDPVEPDEHTGERAHNDVDGSRHGTQVDTFCG